MSSLRNLSAGISIPRDENLNSIVFDASLSSSPKIRPSSDSLCVGYGSRSTSAFSRTNPVKLRALRLRWVIFVPLGESRSIPVFLPYILRIKLSCKVGFNRVIFPPEYPSGRCPTCRGGTEMSTEKVVTVMADVRPAERCELLSLRDSASLCAISERHLRRLIDAGRAPKPISLGRAVRIRRAELLAWLNDGCPAIRKGGVA